MRWPPSPRGENFLASDGGQKIPLAWVFYAWEIRWAVGRELITVVLADCSKGLRSEKTML